MKGGTIDADQGYDEGEPDALRNGESGQDAMRGPGCQDTMGNEETVEELKTPNSRAQEGRDRGQQGHEALMGIHTRMD